MKPVLGVEDLQVWLAGSAEPLLGPLTLQISAGECLGLIGESGSGKSLTAQALLGLLPPGLTASGRLQVEGVDVLLGSPAHRALRGRYLAWAPQDALASLHPLRTVGAQLRESLKILRGLSTDAARREAIDLCERLRLPDPATLLARYPHQLSGGQRQRVVLALALAGGAKLLIADEPTSALDPGLARASLALLDELRRESSLAILLISHDLPLMAAFTQRLAILQRGRCIEQGDSRSILAAPTQAYTRELMAANDLPTSTVSTTGATLLCAERISVHYPRTTLPALQDVSVNLQRGECLAVVGESGSGKSSLGRALLRLLRQGVSGRILLDGEDILRADRVRLRALRRRIGVVFQDPYASLDPRMTVSAIVSEPLRIHGIGTTAMQQSRVAELLVAVGLSADMMGRYPHQFSGGQRQRIAIARALATEPDLLLCDEAVSSLDAQHRAGILALLATLKRERGLAILFITHDFSAARCLAERTAVLANGRLVEQGRTDDLLGRLMPSETCLQAG